MKPLLLAAAPLALALPSAAQERPRCGLPEPSRRAGAALAEAPSDCGYFRTTIQAEYEATYVWDVPVVFHVIQRTNGVGYLSPQTIQDQIDVLNEDFLALPGTPGGPGVHAGFRFHLATLDPSGQPTSGITYAVNDSWYNDNGQYWNQLAWDTRRYLNVYTNSADGYFGYVPDWPQGGIVGQKLDRVVVWWEAVGKEPTDGWPLNQGRTLTHEVGHYFGLDHPFLGGCPGVANCYGNGDLICDTNPQSNATFGCPSSRMSCGYDAAIHNYMDYTDDPCLWTFTPEQVNRMRCTVQHWRPLLAVACQVGLAGATQRNAGENPLSLGTGAPVLGGTLRLAVDLGTSGHEAALVVGFASPLDLALGGGQHLLVNVLDPSGELLGLAPRKGPVASWELPVPATPCGLALSLQAIHMGGVVPFALSNASDVTMGP